MKTSSKVSALNTTAGAFISVRSARMSVAKGWTTMRSFRYFERCGDQRLPAATAISLRKPSVVTGIAWFASMSVRLKSRITCAGFFATQSSRLGLSAKGALFASRRPGFCHGARERDASVAFAGWNKARMWRAEERELSGAFL